IYKIHIVPREKGRMRFHRLQNVQIALDYLKKRQVKLVNIRNDDITDGNPKLTLGLIWTIILHFQISDIHVTGESEDMSAKERLLLWTQQTTEGYATIRCENFTTCWRDGKLFNAIIHKYRPDLVDMSTVAVQSNLANLEHAFYVAEKLGVTRLLDPEDVDVSSPDEKSVITYVSSLYDAFPKVPEGGEGISANDVEVKWVEYQNMVNYLIQWIRHHVTIMSDRTFPNNPVELKALYNQYLQFKETEIPPKEIDKSKIKRLYKLLEVWIEFGRIKLPQGYHPNDIEKEWGKLIIAMLEREKTIRPEVERLEMLQQIANRVQRDSLGCEDKLILARNALQSDAKRLESGLQFQNEAEIAGCLLECENLLRQQVIDVQILIDGKYYQADQLIQRYFIFLFKCIIRYCILIQTYVTGVDSNALQTLKLMQIRKPLMKSAFVDQNLSEEEVNMKFVQDLLNWVDEMQVQLDRAEWGSDLPSVESHLENHKNVLRAIEEFESSLKEAKISEIQMTAPLKLSYAEKLHKLESQYAKLLNTSRNQERHLDTLHNFVSRATAVLIWLNEKEEEEVAYDWSERNSNISRKKEYHADLMRELDQKEEVIKSVQEIAEQLLLENHPARLTIEAYRAAMQTQWSWILQLCHCVEQHLRENAAYFEFFNDAKEAMDYLKNLKDAIQRKYTCDRYSSLHKLEDLVQESMEEKEQLLQYKSTVAGLVGKAKTIIQLKPRNPDSPLKTSIPIKAICDYRQIEITIYKDDECVLASNSHRAKWKVISPSGNEAMVPSVCFTVPPPNKEAIDTANRIEQHFQNVLALWHESHINMKSVVSWHNLMHEIETVRAGNVASIKTMLPGEHQQVLSNLQSRFDDFLEDSQDSKIFSGSDIAQLEKEVNVCKQYYQELLKSAERGKKQEESIYNLYISEVRNIRLRLENCEDRLIRQIRTPLERDDLHESVFRISEQEKLKKELDRLKDDLEMITDKCEEFFSQAAGSPSVPTLRSELNVIIQNMNQVYSMSSIYIEKLKTVNLVLKNTQGAESLVKLYETKLCEEEAVTADKNNIENLMGTLKQWRSEVDEKREVFHALEDELQKAKAISDQMFKTHKERDLDFDWHKEKADQLAERWQNVHSQIENRFVPLHVVVCSEHLLGINKSLKYYKDTYHTLDTWIQQVEDTQRKIQENQPENSKALAKQLNQQKRVLITFPTPLFLQDYELQTMTYRAMVESQQKSPVKRRRMQSSSDFIIQEFMDLRTRYSALVTLMTQYIKFAGDSLKRLEEEEVGHKKSEILMKLIKQMEQDLEYQGNLSEKKFQEREKTESKTQIIKGRYSLIRENGLPICTSVQKIIAGIIDQTTGEVLSVFQSVLKGLIDYDTGIRLLENQLIISGLISPELGICLDLEKAKDHELIDEQTLLQLQELNNAKKILSESSFTNLPAVAALEQGIIPETLAIKILESQLSRGYLDMPATGEQLTLHKAFQKNLVSATLFSNLLERQDTCKDLIDPNTAENISLEEMVQRSIISEETGLRLLPVRPQERGRITLKCGRKRTILRAAHEGLIDRETMFRLLGAQLLSGGVVEPDSGQRMTVEEARRHELIDQDTACGILTHQVQTGGIVCSNSSKRLTVDEAIQCNLISSSSALLVLEAQRGFIGLIWPQTGEIFPISTSLHQGMITSELACKILNGRQKIAALYIPETCEVLSLDNAAQLGIIDRNTVSVLNSVILPDKMPNMEDLESSCKNTAKWFSSYEFHPSALHDCRQEQDISGTDDPIPHTLEQTKKLFMSYLMINSYMDANTGQRLLLYDGDLDEAVSMLLEGNDSATNTEMAEEGFSSTYVNSKKPDLKQPENVILSNVTSNVLSEDTVQQCFQYREKLRGHLTVLQDMKFHLDNQQAISNNLEMLKTQLEQLEVRIILFPSEIRFINNELFFTVSHFLLLYLQNTSKELGSMKIQLDSVAFDVQFFISEHAQDLSPNQSKQLLRLLNSTQKCFQEVQETITSQTESLERLLQTAQDLGDEKVLQIDHLPPITFSCSSHKELQKDMQASALALAEIVKKTEMFLKENGEKLSQEDKTILEQKLNEAKTKCLLLSQKAEESKKNLDKAVTTAIKQETEKAQHEKIISQQQAVIIATQSAQALLEKQGHYLSSEEKEKMQRNMKELKVQYETALAESERKMKLTHSLQEEFEKFDTDYREFENWVQQSEQELENLEAGASDFRGITAKLKRQKSFSEDVISHKGDLRYITISGQRVLDAAKSCSKKDGGKVDKDDIDTSATYMEVQSKLDSASDRFKSLYTKCGILGNNLKDLVDKYQHYEEASSGLLSGLRTSETAVNKQLSEPIAVDPKNLQRQLEETKVKILKKLKKELLVVGRAKQSIIIEVIKDQILSVNEWNEKLQITLTRSLSVQDGLDEMLNWMGSVEKSLKEQGQVPLNSFIITSMQNCCFFQMLEQDIAGRQSSINAMNEKVNKFIETTDPSTASSLQAKMNELSVRFSEASSQHKEKLAKMEELKTKVELFEGLTEKLQSFLDKKTQALNETDAPGKDVTEVSQYMQVLYSFICTYCRFLPPLLTFWQHNQHNKLISPFPPTELTAVQEAMSDVNHSYEDLGVLLKEKFSELESMLSKMQSVQEESNSVMQWLQTMDKAAASWEAAPTDSEAVRAQVEQHKLFETELKQSENKVQELKDKVTELLEKNPDSSEAPKWKQMLDKIDSKWKELNRITADRRQNLEESSNYLTQFQMTEAQLKQWLTEKELMVSVLGPLSIDPNMLNTQKQQVQILLKEFDTRKPQYEQLTTAGQGILKTPGEHPPSHEIVKRQLAAVTQKWESLTGQLSDRYGQIDQAIVKSKEYQSLLRNLSDKLNALDNKLTSTLAVSTQPNTMKQQLEMAKELKQEIEQEMKNIKVAQALCEELSVLVREEYLKAELSRQLEVMLYFILSLAGRHVQQLQSAYATSHQFQQMSKDFQTWLDKKKEELNLARPISAKLDSLQLLIGEQKDFKKTLSDQISSYEKIVAEGESLLQKTQGTDRAELQSQLGMLKSNWDEMNKQVKERQDKLNECLEKALKYKEHVENLQPWIEKCQNNLSEIRIVIDPVEIENSIAQVKVWEKDLDKHHSMVELLNNAADSLLNATQTDKESITDEKEVLNQKMDMVTEQLHNKRESLENMARRLKAFQESSRDTKRQLKSTKEQLEAHDALGSQACSNKHLTMLQSQQKALQNLKPHVHAAKNLAQELVVEASNSAGVSDLLLQAESLEQEYSTVSQQVEDKCSFLETKLQGIGHFQNTIREMFSQFAEFDDELDSMAPVGRDLDTLRSQREDIKNFLKKLEDLITSNKNANKTCKMMLATEASPDLVGIKRDLEALSKQCNKLLDRAKAREEQVEGTISRIEEFYSKLKEFSSLLGGAEEHEESQGPVGMETDTINQQLNIFKVFQKEEIEPLLVKQQEVNWLGQGLIQSAAKNASTENLEHDLEDVNTRWKTLNKKVIILYIHKFNFTFPCFVFSPICDEVVIIQDKLEGIKARYKDITKLSSDVSKTLEQALQLAGQLQSTHEELCVWLDKVEVELLSYDAQIPKGEELSQTQERQKELKKEAKNNKGLLDTLNEVSSALLELVPWRAREGLDKMVTEDNERYRLVSNTLNQKVEEIDAAILRSQQFDQAADAELAWIAETEEKLMSLGDIRLEQDQTATQLQVQKAFTMEILRHKDAIDELVESGDEIMNTCTEEEKQSMKKKLESLLQKYEMVCQMNAERNLQLERAQSLVNQFWETYEELWPWLTKTEMVISQLPAPALEYELLKQQQEEHRQLRELIAEHKPHIDKMNKTGPQLLELSPGEGFCIQEKYVAADTLYSQIKEDVKKRALALDEAISQSTQFHDKIDPTLESLERIVERLRQPPSISAEVEKIKEQISENKNVSVDLEKLQPVYETLKQRGEEMIARSEGADKDVSAKAVQDKLKQMVFIWEEIQVLTEEREAKLLDVMELAEKFWCDHMALVITIKDTQDFIRELEGPGVDPSVVKQQQEGAEVSQKEEVDGLQEELDIVVNLGSELIAACGEPDKPIVNKSIDELNSAWDTLNKAWKERVDKLDEAMQAAVQYQDGLQAIFDWVDIAGSKLASMSPVGTDLETVKQQTEELKQFKTEAYQQQIEMERLNHQAELLLKKVTEESDKHTVQDPLSELRLMWVNLEEKIINRQHKLEGALLALGQFQHALDELLTWLTHTEDLLNEQKPVGGDPKAIEIELAKHHVLQNDVLAHQSTVETVRKAGNDLIESSAVEEASNLQSKLELLNQRWENVLKKTEQRKQQLDSALIQAQGFHGEVEDMHQWLTDTERLLLASKPVGGLPETAREQLNTHMELCAAFEAKEETYKRLMQKGLQMLARCPESAETNVEQDINNLKVKWDSVQTKLSERKIKLEEALNLAMEFHNSLQDFINWLTQAEQTLTMASRPSLILDTILFQIDEHKVFATEVNSHRDQIIELDKIGTHLKYFSQKQDVVLIKNLLISVQSRWEKVVQRLVERGRALDDARKRSKQFHEAWNKLMAWLEESEKLLDSELEIANDPDKIKMQLTQHKEFQKSLGAKHSVYDTTNRTGRSLKEKTSLADDNLKLDDMLSELRDKWDTICGKSVERQNKLEEALLFSGQFTDALQALIDWLYKIEPQLAEDQPVHGDIDLVMNLIDNHKVFQKELGKRTSSVQALKRSARELIEGSRDDSSWVKVQMQELSTRWETVCALSVSKQTRLEQALHQAEEFHSVVHVLLEWLAEAEQALRFHGILPDDDEALRALIDQHREFMRKLEDKKAELNKATGMGEAILAICHPDSITTIKHWITIIRARFEEVLAWAKQHQQRLAGALAGLIAKQELLEALLSWLQWAETTLSEKDKEVIPQEIEDVKALIAEHQMFMEEMTRKQPDVDKVTKTYKRKTVEPTPTKPRCFNCCVVLPWEWQNAQIETKNPRVNLLVSKWQQVWLLALERRRKLNDALDRLEELREFANFDFDIWRKKYMRWMNHKKSRVMDFFRRIDKDQDGKITRQEFIDGILSSKFPTSRLEMSAVADIFDRDGDGYIDYYEFVAALHPNKDAYKPLTDADKIEDEVTRQVAKCKCAKRFQVEQIGDNKYRVSLHNTSMFGDSQQLRLVRILRSTVMVRVGGGWMALDEFLVKNDPCRGM
uniref:Dystonin n=1 Tax=Pelusios castaneus TaxID=367368 RepID=A0A8C8S7S6_9SAUR